MQKMSEQEAIEALKLEGGIEITGKPLRIAKFFEGLEVAITALEEIQQYRAIDTVEECRKAAERMKPEQPNLHMNEVSGMFVDYADGHGEYKTQMNNWWRCPRCNSVVGQRVIVHGRKHDQHKKKFCKECGQAID